MAGFLLGLIVVLLLVIVPLLSKSKGRGAQIFANPVMNPEELKLYWRLRTAAPSLSVFPQVALSQLLKCDDQSTRNGFSQLVADFVICDRSAKALLIIELDGKDHNKPAQKKRDARKDSALAEAGIEVVRWRAGKVPPDDKIAAILAEAAKPEEPKV